MNMLRRVGLLTAIGLAATGCRREEASVYQVSKESQSRPPVSVPAHGQGEVQGGRSSAFNYETPTGWTALPASGMSVVRFQVPGKEGEEADVAAMSLPGGAAKDLDVINIFRERLQMPVVEEAALKALAKPVPVGVGEGRLYDFSGTAGASNTPVRLLVTVVDQGPAAWYFRMTGAPATVEAQSGAFLGFLKSVSFEAVPATLLSTSRVGGATPSAPASAASAAAGGAPAVGESLPVTKPAWEVPAGWQEAAPGPMVLAKFTVGQGDSKAELTVSSFPGDVGGLVANVNRWRGQIGLGAVSDAEARDQASAVDINGAEARLVDLTGERQGKKTRLVGVVVPKGGQTWFYKLVGDDVIAGREKENLLKFVRSAR